MPDIFISPEEKTPVPAPTKNQAPAKLDLTQTNKIPLRSQALSAYMFLPQDMKFETQEPGETIILLLRKHWITNSHWIILSLLLIILPVIIFPSVILTGTFPPQIPHRFVSVIILGWYLLTFSYVFANFLLWYFTVAIITSERVIEIEFINLLNKKFAETRIARVEDVSMRTGGFIRGLFDYGDVLVQTAAKDAQFEFLAVPHPDDVVSIINELLGKEEDEGKGVVS